MKPSYGMEVEGVIQLYDIYHQRSLDGGETWSAPARITDGEQGELVPRTGPNLSVAPNGRLDAVWTDFREPHAEFADLQPVTPSVLL